MHTRRYSAFISYRHADHTQKGRRWAEWLHHALERYVVPPGLIGDRGKGPGPKCSDGVVPYASAHLPGAVSEVLVPHWHGCVEKPETVTEVLRILRAHLRG